MKKIITIILTFYSLSANAQNIASTLKNVDTGFANERTVFIGEARDSTWITTLSVGKYKGRAYRSPRPFVFLYLNKDSTYEIPKSIDSNTVIRQLMQSSMIYGERFYKARCLIYWVRWDNLIRSVKDKKIRAEIRKVYNEYKKSIE